MALAGALERLQEEAVCPICLECMSEPVSIDCGHNFCRGCIVQHCQDKGLWANGHFFCPQCRASCHSSGLRPNRQLGNMVESIRQLGLGDGPQRELGAGPGPLLCPQHGERLKLFCEEDGKAICVVCRESQYHRSHTISPADEAVQVYKLKLYKALERRVKEIEKVKERETSERLKIQECKEVVREKRESIVSEFGKLFRMLAEEQKVLLEKLQEEEKHILAQISQNLDTLLEQKSFLEHMIREMREKTQQSDEELLKDMKKCLISYEGMLFPPPRVVSVTLKENYSIPEHCLCMRDMLKKFKVDVTLDPETAYPELILSEDRKSVQCSNKKLLFSFENPRRFSSVPVVLGHQILFSGRSYWEVQVGDKPEWGLGLCRESANRRGNIVFSPTNGYWVLRLQSGGGYEALTSPVSPLSLSVRPRRVGIFLDYEAGELSFYNVSARSHIYTFTDKFSGRLRPLFFAGSFLGGRNAEPLVISWVRDTQGTSCVVL